MSCARSQAPAWECGKEAPASKIIEARASKTWVTIYAPEGKPELGNQRIIVGWAERREAHHRDDI